MRAGDLRARKRWSPRSFLLLFLLAIPMVIALASSGCRTIRAARILREAQRPAHELTSGVREESVDVHGVRVHVYRPSEGDGPWPSVLLCHGAVDAGARDARLVALARAFARHGVLVACPELRSLSRFRADTRDVEHLVEVTRWLLALPDRGAEPVSLVGISIGGSYCLLTAARTEVREDVSAVLSFGAYENLEGLLRTWLVAPQQGVPELYDPLVEGRRRVLLGNLEGLVPESDRGTLRRALMELLAGTEVHPGAAQGLGPDGLRLFECARSTDPIDPVTADAVLAPLRAELHALSPGEGEAPAAKIFLLHGKTDPIVPPTETAALEIALADHGARVHAHVTDAFTHVGPKGSGSFFGTWSLLRFLAGFLKAAGI